MSRLKQTFTSYLRSARYLSLEPGRTWPTSLLAIVWVRGRYGMNPDNLAFFSLDGKWPKRPGDYVHRWNQIEGFMRRMNPEMHYFAVDDKIVFYQRCLGNSLPTPAILAAIPAANAGGDAGPRSVPAVGTAQDLAAQFDSRPGQEFFCKPLGGINGKGGFGFKRTADGFSCKGRPVSAEALFFQIQGVAERYGTMIVQERLHLHPSMLAVSPSGALSTVRVLTCLDDGAVRPVAALLKICAGDNETDNFHQGMNGNLVASIDLETGRLSKAVGSASREFPLMRSYSNHPDNQHPIEDFQLPNWPELLALAKRGHDEFSEFWTLGWDVALTNRGPVLIEANPIWATGFMQVAAGKGMRDEFDRWKARLEKGAGHEARVQQDRAEEAGR